MTTHTQSDDLHAKAIQLRAQLAAVRLSDVPVVYAVRSGTTRKELAKLTRQLFSRLGLRGISVRAPNYSMAQSIDITLPGRRDFVTDQWGMAVDWANDPAAMANREAERKVHAIMARAFPNHDNRSDSQTDYFDYKYSIDTRTI